jgi:hypothetical protein
MSAISTEEQIFGRQNLSCYLSQTVIDFFQPPDPQDHGHRVNVSPTTASEKADIALINI